MQPTNSVGIDGEDVNAMMRAPRPSARQQGFSLAEVLVVVALLMVVTTIVAGAVLTANQTTRRTTDAAYTQAQLLDSVSRISREVALSDPIVSASPNRIELQSTRNDKCLGTAFYVWFPGDAFPNTKAQTAVQTLPPAAQQSPVLVQDTYASTSKTCLPFTGDPTTSDVLATNVTLSMPTDPNQEAARSSVLFNFFDASGGIIALVNQSGKWVVEDANSIERVGINLKAKALDRKNGLSLTTSVAPRLKLPTGTNIDDLPAPAKPQLFGVILPGTRDARLTWNPVLGATGYILLSDQAPAAPGTIIFTAPDANTLEYVDATLPWGETQNYQVIATGIGGNTPSNIVALTVVPDCTRVTGTPIAAGADGIANDVRLTWTVPTGTTAFQVHRSGTGKIADLPASTTAYTDTNRPAGTSSTYHVVASNGGGVGANCNSVAVVAAPPAPALTASVPTDTNTVQLRWNATTGATGYDLYNGGTLIWSGSGTAMDHTGRNWGADHGYTVRAKNTAGVSPASNQAIGKVGPGPFDLWYDNWRPAFYDDYWGGRITPRWSASAGANQYRSERWDNLGGCPWYGCGHFDQWYGAGSRNDEGRSGSTHPTVPYTYKLTAYAPNGTSRAVQHSVQAPPEGPRYIGTEMIYQTSGWRHMRGRFWIDGNTNNGGRNTTGVWQHYNQGAVYWYGQAGISFETPNVDILRGNVALVGVTSYRDNYTGSQVWFPYSRTVKHGVTQTGTGETYMMNSPRSSEGVMSPAGSPTTGYYSPWGHNTDLWKQTRAWGNPPGWAG